MERRTVLRAAAVGSAVAVGGAAFSGALWRLAFAGSDQPGPSPYGDLLGADGNGIQLPSGFASRVLGRSRQRVAGTSYTWHDAPDGGACFPDCDGWIYVSNSEIPFLGGVGALRFAAAGAVTDAYRVLFGTNVNCAGGATPWGTWLSCEEVPLGRVFETFPGGGQDAISRDRMGRFKHEAAACDPDRRVVYLTEDEGDGCFYRFVPDAWGDLGSGRLEVLCAPADVTSGPVSWREVPDRDDFPIPTRWQVGAAKLFDGGEGCYYAGGVCYFTTKGDNRVWAYDAVNQRIDLSYDAATLPAGTAPLTGVDNITGSSTGDLFVAEDGGDMEINMITPGGVVAPFLRILGQSSSEITGPAFSPDGSRLYFSSQRGTSGQSSGGIIYEVSGPFRS